MRPHGAAFDLVAGLGRLLALRQLGWDQIPVRMVADTNKAAALARLSENVTRTNLTPVDEALQLHTLVETHPQGTIGVADAIGRTQTWVEDRLDILTWPECLIEYVADRRISLAAAKHLARIEDPVTLEMYARDAANNGITARTAANWRAQAAGQAPLENALPENGVPAPRETVKTTVTAVCFCCREEKGIDETRAVRICAGCLTQLGTEPSSNDDRSAPTDRPPPTPD